MDLEKFKNLFKGKYNSAELEEFKNRLFSEEGKKQMEHLFDSFEVGETDADEKNLEGRLLDNIHSKLNIEELIKEISIEHKKHERILDKSRGPISLKRSNGILRLAYITGILVIAGLIGWAVDFAFVDINTLQENNTSQVKYLNKSTGKGQKLTIHLSDGSKVILNSKSSIEYPEVFDDSLREVTIQGEAFFDVAHNEEKPFIVHAGSINSKVLGTTFNVQHRPEDDVNVVALVSGKVQVSFDQQKESDNSFILAPGELMKINPEGTFQKQKFNIEREIGWKDNIIFFTDADYQQVFSTLEDWYGVEIDLTSCSGKISWNLTAKFENENLENILHALSLSQGIRYELNEKKVIIKF